MADALNQAVLLVLRCCSPSTVQLLPSQWRHPFSLHERSAKVRLVVEPTFECYLCQHPA